DLTQEPGIGRRVSVRARADELLGEEREHHHDEDREGGAFEETTHGLWCCYSALSPRPFSRRASVAGGFWRSCRCKRAPGPISSLSEATCSRLPRISQDGHIRQVSVALGVVQPVADRELIRDL